MLLALTARGEDSPCKIRLISIPSSSPKIEVTYLNAEAKPVRQSVPAIVVPRGTPLYHWTYDKRTYRGWVSAGRVPEGTMNAITGPKANGGAVGGGAYVSTSVWDSRGYGNHLVLLEAPHDLILVPFELSQTIGPPCHGLLEAKTLLNAGFDGVHDQPKTWMALMNSRATAKVKGLGDTSTVLGAIHDLTLCELAELNAKMPLVPNDALARYYPALYKVLSRRPMWRSERETMLYEIQEGLKEESTGNCWAPGLEPRNKCLHCGLMKDQASFLRKLKRRVEASAVQADPEQTPNGIFEIEHAPNGETMH